MTTLRHSPPRSKKESFVASEAPAPAVELTSETLGEVAEVGPDARQLKAAARQERLAAKEAANQRRAAEAEAKQEAKQRARVERMRSREQAARSKVEARAEAAAAKAAAQVDTESAQQEAPELAVPATAPALPTPPPRHQARQGARSERAVADSARRTKAAQQAVEDDHIVEPPRAPKLDRADRRRQAKAERARAKQEQRLIAGERGTTSSSSARGGKRAGLLVAGLLGAIGLICSVILALGALLVALGATDGNSAYDFISTICDALVGPLRDLFSFSGTNARMKESLVAWGAGSIGYLLVGIVVQSFLRARFEDD